MSRNKLSQRIMSLASKNGQPSGDIPMAKRPPLAQKDREVREDAFKFGVVVSSDGKKLACVFLDLSPSGARIKLNCATALPSRVRVSIPSVGFRREAEVRWQMGAETGLKFLN